MSSETSAYRPALIIVDFQNDFCPPNGALAVDGGRDIAGLINTFLTFPFHLKIATKDFHPRDHISFASNHSPPLNRPFDSIISIRNPENPDEIEETRLWPDHCVQGTSGADLVPELDQTRLHHVIEKGQDPRVEMYSAFGAPFANPPIAVSKLAGILRSEHITHVFVVGLAYDYCVKCTAIDAVKEGFTTYVVKDASRPVHAADSEREETDAAYRKHGVSVITSESPEVAQVKAIRVA